MTSDAPVDGSLLRLVTNDERETFERDGVVHLQGIYPLDWLVYLEEQLVDIFDNQPSRLKRPPETGTSTDGVRVDMAKLVNQRRAAAPDITFAIEGRAHAELAGRSIVETDASSWHEQLRNHHVLGPLPHLVGTLTTTDKVTFYSDQLFLKEPGSRVQTPFHQDEPYFLVDGTVAVCWVPVDAVGADNGPMQYVRGSHRWNRLFKPSDFVTTNGTFPQVDGIDHSALEAMPSINPDEHDVVSFETKPGDVIVHHWSTIHGAKGNVSAKATRRAASVRYALGDSTYLQRPSSPEPFRYTTGLTTGDALDAATRFPIVWRAS